MPEEKRISPGVIIVGGLGLGLAAAVGIAALALAAPPAEGYACPYCPATCATYEELVAHVQTEHPGERIPLPIEWE
ncbi:hypothetical protein ES706_06067 [subsurface metagenome]